MSVLCYKRLPADVVLLHYWHLLWLLKLYVPICIVLLKWQCAYDRCHGTYIGHVYV